MSDLCATLGFLDDALVRKDVPVFMEKHSDLLKAIEATDSVKNSLVWSAAFNGVCGLDPCAAFAMATRTLCAPNTGPKLAQEAASKLLTCSEGVFSQYPLETYSGIALAYMVNTSFPGYLSTPITARAGRQLQLRETTLLQEETPGIVRAMAAPLLLKEKREIRRFQIFAETSFGIFLERALQHKAQSVLKTLSAFPKETLGDTFLGTIVHRKKEELCRKMPTACSRITDVKPDSADLWTMKEMPFSQATPLKASSPTTPEPIFDRAFLLKYCSPQWQKDISP